MKYLTLIPLVFVTSCASHPTRHVFMSVPPPPAVEPIEGVRYPDLVRAYHVGRSVDPNHPDEMQEAHTVFRVEAQSRWNRHPGRLPLAPLVPGAALKNAAFSPAPVNDAIVAELNRQKAIMQTIIAQHTKLTESLQQLGAALVEAKSVAQGERVLREQLNGALKRLDLLQAEMKRLQAEQVPTNALPTSPQ